MGIVLMEDLVWDESGRYLSANPSTYKIPGIRDIPEILHVEMVESNSREASVFGSKAVGEPPLIYGLSVFFALQRAVQAANPDAMLHFPATPESLITAIWST